MADQEKSFPDPGAKPGDYTLEWLVGKRRRFSGEVALAPRRLPQIQLHGKLRRPRKNAAGELVYFIPGQDVHLPRLVGRLYSNEEVVVIDAALSEWFPERFVGRGRWAIVGLGVADVPDDRYERVSFQISGADLWFGAPPLSNTKWPKPADATKTFSATLNKKAHRVWRDTRNGITIDFGYPHTFSLDPYRFGLTFAPVFDIESKYPLTLDEWRDQWIAPLVDLASFATKEAQTLSWLNVLHGTDRSRINGTVFTGGIHQSPYSAHYEDEWKRDPGRKPLFTLAQVSLTPMKLVRKWRELQKSDDPFVELYRAALFQLDLPPRARYLHLIQALEARHSYANRRKDEREQIEFTAKRQAVIDAATKAGLPAQHSQFLNSKWSKRAPSSLDQRLAPLLRDLPSGVRQRVASDPNLDPIRSQLTADSGVSTLHEQLRVLRNQLSHGDRNYDDRELRPWVTVAETICQAQLLGLLGFSPSDLTKALSAS
jgi:hypothetical protein